MPGGDVRWELALLVHERETDLYYLKYVDVHTEQLVLIVRLRSKITNRTGDDTRKLRILGRKMGV